MRTAGSMIAVLMIIPHHVSSLTDVGWTSSESSKKCQRDKNAHEKVKWHSGKFGPLCLWTCILTKTLAQERLTPYMVVGMNPYILKAKYGKRILAKIESTQILTEE